MVHIDNTKANLILSNKVDPFLNNVEDFVKLYKESKKNIEERQQIFDKTLKLADTGFSSMIDYAKKMNLSLPALITVAEHIIGKKDLKNGLPVPFYAGLEDSVLSICKIRGSDDGEVQLEQVFPKCEQVSVDIEFFYSILGQVKVFLDEYIRPYQKLYDYSISKFKQVFGLVDSIQSEYFDSAVSLFDSMSLYKQNMSDYIEKTSSIDKNEFSKLINNHPDYVNFLEYIQKTVPKFFSEVIYNRFAIEVNEKITSSSDSVAVEIRNFITYAEGCSEKSLKLFVLKKVYALNNAASIFTDLCGILNEVSRQYCATMKKTFDEYRRFSKQF